GAPESVPEEPGRRPRPLPQGPHPGNEPRPVEPPHPGRVLGGRQVRHQGPRPAVPGRRDRGRHRRPHGGEPMTDVAPPTTTKKDWSSDQEVRWCPGGGDYSI